MSVFSVSCFEKAAFEECNIGSVSRLHFVTTELNYLVSRKVHSLYIYFQSHDQFVSETVYCKRNRLLPAIFPCVHHIIKK